MLPEVYVSAVVHDQVEGTFVARYEDVGDHTAKNIDNRPVARSIARHMMS